MPGVTEPPDEGNGQQEYWTFPSSLSSVFIQSDRVVGGVERYLLEVSDHE